MKLFTDPAQRLRFYALWIVVMVLWLVFLLHGCGREYNTAYNTQPPAAHEPYSAVAPVVARSCGGCHGVRPGIPVFRDEASFHTAAVLHELQAGTMPPPPATISADDRAALLAYF